ncbi:MAG: hypothetical protein KJ847_04330 [Firmicutes bacterium]|nr:hypothetical protein [Bacillota bacterium]
MNVDQIQDGLHKMEKIIQRRSIVLLLPMDSETADEITSAAVSFLKANYKLKQQQIEINKRSIFIKNYVEV